MDQDPLLQGALFSYEPFSGEIKVIVGGTSFQKSEYNRAIQALRQPGSTIKPLIYAAALDKGYTPNTTIMDSPLVYKESGGKTWEPKNYGGGFSNAAITFRSALVQSKNVVTVRILMDIGTHYATAFMRKCGFASDIKKFYSMALGSSEVTLYEISRAYGVFATGGVLPELHFIRKIVDPSGKVVEEVIPPDPSKFIITWDPGKTSSNPEENPPGATSKKGEKASGEAQIPETQQSPESQNSLENPWPETLPQHPKRYGKKGGKIERVPWDEMPFRADLMQQGEEVAKKDQLNLSDYEKKILYGNYIPAGHVITPRTAATMVSVLQDVVKYGTGTPVLPLKKPAAGKTGTTNGATDAWFIGFTPTLVTGVWIGHDERIKTIGHNATGGHVAAPIWLSFMQEATKKYPTKSFKLPAWLDLTQYQTPMEIVKGDSEAIEGTGDGPSSENKGKGTSGAEFFSTDPL